MMKNKMASHEYAGARTMVWLDIHNCPIPDPHLVGRRIDSALMKLGYFGPLRIKAVGNMHKVDKNLIQKLHSSGIALRHVFYGSSNIVDDFDMWEESNNEVPYNLMFASDLETMSVVYCYLAQMKEMGCNVLYAYSDTLPTNRDAAKSVPKHGDCVEWLWDSLLHDEDEDIRGRNDVVESCIGNTDDVLEEENGVFAELYCTPCHMEFQSFDEFATHIDGPAHDDLMPITSDDDEEEEDDEEKDPLEED
ncbi:unnamed protein product [Cochlearia groenlandica]